MSGTLKVVLSVLGGFVMLFLLLSMSAEPDRRHLGERIAEACKREFGYSQRDVTQAEFECTLKLLNRWAAERERDKLDRAYGSAR